MKKTILVTGDPICDHNYYKGKRPTADSKEPRGFRSERVGGGSLLLKDQLVPVIAAGLKAQAEADAQAKADAIAKGEDETARVARDDWQVEFGLNDDFRTLPSAYHSFCIWEPLVGTTGADPKTSPLFWRTLEPALGYGQIGHHPDEGMGRELRTNAYDSSTTPCTPNPDIVVIDDAGLGFRSVDHSALCECLKRDDKETCPRWVVLKLTGPIGESPLWDKLTSQCEDNLVVIVPAEELRRRDVRLSQGLSWEATAEDLTAELLDNPRLTPLLKARHLIVTFQSDAAYWRERAKTSKAPEVPETPKAPDVPHSLLVFDARRAEGEWAQEQGDGTAFGFLSCFTAAIVKELCLPKDPSQPDLETAIVAGLSAGRALRRLGHGALVDKEGNEPKPGFPFAQIEVEINSKPGDTFVSALIPHEVGIKKADGNSGRGHWMMLEEWQVQARTTSKLRPHYEAAMAVAVQGPEVLGRFPVARFGSYQTVDRKEIESLRTIRQLILNYTSIKKQKTPLNLGVFGPPGSGKSYIVLEIAKAVGIKEEDVKIFNLSQFSDPADLFGAFHQVRDMILRGTTPLIFWDEFDAQGYRWLQYLLAPMEDGEFQDGQITHPIGKCIFVFAGATSSTFDKFGPINPDGISDVPQEMDKAWRAFVLAKGPDFKSRLVGYLNILGVNRKLKCKETDGRRVWSEDEKDLCFPIRRALFMRSLFKIKKGARLELDPQVIKALLEMPKFKGGGRSLQFLCSHLKNSSDQPGRSNLPGYELLNMHVDADLFWELCEQDIKFVPKAAELASLLHTGYRLRTSGNAEKKDVQVEFENLPEDLQKANVAQALRIPGILRLAGMHLEPGDMVPFEKLLEFRSAPEESLRQHLAEKDRLEVLAEAEHNGWMVERMLSGWKFSRKKDKSKKLHDCLIPYSQLSDEVKGYDRKTITGKADPKAKPEEEQFGYVDMVKVVGLRVVMDAVVPVAAKS